MDITKKLSQELEIKEKQAQAVITLIDEGNTIPFIARYRKEATGGLNDEVLRTFMERLTYLRSLEERRNAVLKSIESQGKLTKDLEIQIKQADTLIEVEDLYRPYKQKRRTRAMIARERGLEGLSNLLLIQKSQVSLEQEAKKFLNEEVTSVEDAIGGARDIIAETIADDAKHRAYIRKYTWEHGMVTSTKKGEASDAINEMYYDFEEEVRKIKGYRILAINRGEKEKALAVKIQVQEEKIIQYLEKKIIKKFAKEEIKEQLQLAISDAYKRLIAPAVEREIRSQLTETAEEEAMKVFGSNLQQLLLQPPIAGQIVLGWDPAFRTGCKLAVVDATGKVLDTVVIYPTAPQHKVEEAKKKVKEFIKKYGITLISIGNGTASRESEQIVVDLLKEIGEPVSYVITNEAGASVYSASKLATEEFPNFDVGQRSAVSIARRVQDPLAELVKIEPKAIGVGQYQHDMNQKKLEQVLQGVVEDVVNSVGVDLNTASASLLGYISGVNQTIAKNIVSYREEHGRFENRKQLLKVAKLGPKAFQQCAGFLRVTGGTQPLDQTAVHPESYDAAKALMESLGYEEKDLTAQGLKGLGGKIKDRAKKAEELGIGRMTLDDIVKELEKPGRDPREEMPKPLLRKDIMEMSDLKEGMILKGTVRNVIDFGAFVDIGVHQDGLVHISELSDRYIKHPMEVVSVGDIVTVKVLSVDEKKHRIALSMKNING